MAFLNLGFRPFFFGASVAAVLLMAMWFWFFQFNSQLINQIHSHYWHAHEMIFGYTVAVIVGFLLTAVKNWTGIQTINGPGLLILFLLWVSARLLPFIAHVPLLPKAIIDTSFLLFAAFFIVQPIIRSRLWKNLAIATKLMLIAMAHIVFYMGLLGILENGARWGLYGAFYLIIALIFVIARRVIPFFIERGVGSDKPLKNNIWIDRASMVLFIAYAGLEIFWPTRIVYIFAFLLFILHSIRLYNWYCSGIWRIPLLWSLYLAYAFLTNKVRW